MRYVVAGDFHIDEFNLNIHERIIEELENSDGIIIPGDITSSKVLDFFKATGKKVIAVRGNCDLDLDFLKYYEEFKVGDKKIGVIHSHTFGRGNIEGIRKYAESRNLDILIFGHTHQDYYDNKSKPILLNPGTATGTPSGSGYKAGKTYAILEINDGVEAEILIL